jgi:hypothetical protein
MSAPRTNVETQKLRHRGPLVGMALVVLFALAIMFYWLWEEASEAENPQGGDLQQSGGGITVEDADTGRLATPEEGGTDAVQTAPGGGGPVPSPPPAQPD